MARIKQIKRVESSEEIEIGDQVLHSKFGMGTVLYKSGSGDRAKAIVVFAEEGQKKLLLKYAKLKKIRETKQPEEPSEEEILATLNDTVSSKKKKKSADNKGGEE